MGYKNLKVLKNIFHNNLSTKLYFYPILKLEQILALVFLVENPSPFEVYRSNKTNDAICPLCPATFFFGQPNMPSYSLSHVADSSYPIFFLTKCLELSIILFMPLQHPRLVVPINNLRCSHKKKRLVDHLTSQLAIMHGF